MEAKQECVAARLSDTILRMCGVCDGPFQGLPAEDMRKLQYALDMCMTEDPFAGAAKVDPTITEACASRL